MSESSPVQPDRPDQPGPQPHGTYPYGQSPYGPHPPSAYAHGPHQYGYGYPYGMPPATDPLISPDYSGWWRRGLSIVRRGWKPLAALQAGGMLLSLLFAAPVLVASRRLESTPAMDIDYGLFGAAAGLALLSGLVLVVSIAVVTLASVHVIVSVAVAAPVRVEEALALAGRRLLPLLGWGLLAAPICLVAMSLCFLLVFYVAAALLVLPVVVAVERTGAIGRCFKLFHRDLGASAARVATILGVGFALGMFFDAVAVAVAVSLVTVGPDVFALGPNEPDFAALLPVQIVGSLAAAVLGVALAVLIAPLTVTAYADMRARVEPVSAGRIAQELGIVVAAVPPANPEG